MKKRSSDPTTAPQGERADTALRRYPRKPLPHFTIILIPVLSFLSGILLGAAMPGLIGADSIWDYIKCVLFGVAGTMVSYGVNRLAIERGTYQAAIGTPGAMIASCGSILVVGIALFGATYTGLTGEATDQLRLEEFGRAQDIAIDNDMDGSRAAARIVPLINSLRGDLHQKAECERLSSCLSGRGNGGEGPVYAATLSEVQKADAVAAQVAAGAARFESELGNLKAQQLQYQTAITGDDLGADERRNRAQAIAADVSQTLGKLREATPVALVAAYGESLHRPVMIPQRPQASATLNNIRSGYAGQIQSVIASLSNDTITYPSIPPRSGVSDALSRIGHFLPVAMIVAAIELVFPMLLWLTTYFGLLARVAREEGPAPEKPARRRRGHRS